MATYYVDAVGGNDANAGTSAGAAKQTLSAGFALVTATGDTLNIKASADYTLTTGVSIGTGPSYIGQTLIRGYTTTPGDGGKAVVKAGADSITLVGGGGQQGLVFDSLTLDGNGHSSIVGLDLNLWNTASAMLVRNCATGVKVNQFCRLIDSEVTACTSIAVEFTGPGLVRNCNIHSNSCTALSRNYSDSGGSILNNLIWGNTGGSSNGIAVGYNTCVIEGNVIWGNGANGILIQSNYVGLVQSIKHNIIGNNGGYNVTCVTTPTAAPSRIAVMDFNALYTSTSGDYDTTKLSGGLNDIALTADPFVDAASGDFNLNNVSGGGALLRAVTFDMPG